MWLWATFLENGAWDCNKMQKDIGAWPHWKTNLIRCLKEMKRRQTVSLEQICFLQEFRNLVKSILSGWIFWPLFGSMVANHSTSDTTTTLTKNLFERYNTYILKQCISGFPFENKISLFKVLVTSGSLKKIPGSKKSLKNCKDLMPVRGKMAAFTRKKYFILFYKTYLI